jgi:hypothetical protein
LTPLRAALDRALNDDIIDPNPLDKSKVSKLVDNNQAKTDYEVDPFSSREMEIALLLPEYRFPESRTQSP